ncbi:ABC transporter permease [Lysinibacillus sp. NPDC094403]|uniref:ABC transporter permease n=1 Tax=Lysinibacillus sp. NPDC094403 TaxID=3390581 RepID=UPI003D0914C6
MVAIQKLTLTELKLFFRDLQSMIWTFIFPFVMIYFLGFLFGSSEVDDVNYKTLLIPNMIALSLLSTALFTLGTRIVSYKESQLLRTYQTTPLHSIRMILSFCVFGVIISLFSIIISFTSGYIIYHVQAPMYLLATIGALALSMAALFSFGILVTGISSTMQGAAGISVLALNLQTFLSGGVIPYQILPIPLKIIAKALPLHYVNDLLTFTWTGQSVNPIWIDVLILFLMAIFFIMLSIRFFKWS